MNKDLIIILLIALLVISNLFTLLIIYDLSLSFKNPKYTIGERGDLCIKYDKPFFFQDVTCDFYYLNPYYPKYYYNKTIELQGEEK